MSQSAPAPSHFPPYADLVRADVRTVYISAGPRAWERARRWKRQGEPGLVADPRVDPASVRWPIAGRNVALIATDLPRPQLVELLIALRRARPAVIAVLHGPDDGEALEILRGRHRG